jgi:hypothetical protein
MSSNLPRDAITDRALAALNADSSSDDDDTDGVEEVGRLSAAENENESEPSHQPKIEQGIKNESGHETHTSIEQPQRSDEIIDLTLDSSDEDDVPVKPSAARPSNVPSAAKRKSSGNMFIKDSNVNNQQNPSSNQRTRCNVLRILDESRVPTKPIPAGERVPILSGKLSVSKNGASCQLLLRGVWYKKGPNYTPSPERFELISDLASSVANSETLPSTCEFNGFFVHQNTVVQERDVNIAFHTTDVQSATFTVKGSGTNQFGRFEINGTATRLNKRDETSFSVMLTKVYVESFGAPRKRKSSETDSDIMDFNNNCKSLRCSQEKAPHKHSGSKSADSPPLLTDEQTSKDLMVCSLAQKGPLHDHSLAAKSKELTGAKCRITVFDQVHHVAPNALTSYKKQTIAAPTNPKSSNVARPRESINNWQEFGALSGATPTKSETGAPQQQSKPHLSWTIRDVRPCFPVTTLDFWYVVSKPQLDYVVANSFINFLLSLLFKRF